MRPDSTILRGEAVSHSNPERLEGFHLPVEPCFGIRPKTICPTESRSDIFDSQIPQYADTVVQAMILEMEPLADTELGCVL
jgi:hypothetical protein